MNFFVKIICEFCLLAQIICAFLLGLFDLTSNFDQDLRMEIGNVIVSINSALTYFTLLLFIYEILSLIHSKIKVKSKV